MLAKLGDDVSERQPTFFFFFKFRLYFTRFPRLTAVASSRLVSWVELWSLKRKTRIQIPRTWECYLEKKRIFVDVVKGLQMRRASWMI